MDELIVALGPAFAAGFAIQRLMEILDPILDKVKNKKIFLGILSLIAGLALAFGVGLRVLEPLGIPNEKFWDAIITAFIISAGTEGFNSIMKFLGYKKEEKKGEASLSKKEAEKDAEALKSLTKAV